MKTLTVSILFIIWANLILSTTLQASWIVEWLGGFVYNFKTPLVIRQSGYEDIKLNAQYRTKPLGLPIYYALRIARGKENYWELELIHHKLFLKNKPNAVQDFSITHGYNLLVINRAWKYQKILFRLGAGVVIAHPETTIRNKKYSEKKGIFNRGYYIAGPVIQVALEKRFNLYKKLFAIIEGKFTSSFSRIPIRDGNADVLNLAFHGLLGLSYHF